jgi:hypothetical protein
LLPRKRKVTGTGLFHWQALTAASSLVLQPSLNPLARPLALDVRAQAKDLELPPLSHYSSKFAGDGIELAV